MPYEPFNRLSFFLLFLLLLRWLCFCLLLLLLLLLLLFWLLLLLLDLPGTNKDHPDYDFDAMPTLVKEQQRITKQYYPHLDTPMEGTTAHSDEVWLNSLRHHKIDVNDPFAGDDPMTAAAKRIHQTQQDAVVSDDDFRFKEASTPRSSSGRSLVDWDSYKGVNAKLHTAPVRIRENDRESFNRPAQPGFDWSIPTERVDAPPRASFSQMPPRFVQQEHSATITNTLGPRAVSQNPALLETAARATVEVATFGHPRHTVQHALRKRQSGSLVELSARVHATTKARARRTSSLPIPWPSTVNPRVDKELTGISMPIPLTHNKMQPDYERFNHY